MKAWKVHNYDNDVSAIVFAPTKGKAKSVALRRDLLSDEYINFTDISCYRIKEGDKFYNGKSYLDWENDEDRLLMVKEFGFTCSEEWYTEKECYYCVAKEFCSLHKEMQEREE